ncbi:MAG: DUF3137 domain-containing protein [Candidatus Saccharibacteria bacterium]|nr:DUF3137 domain-containing protein [Candidatus Saccharibacteria bacterium]
MTFNELEEIRKNYAKKQRKISLIIVVAVIAVTAIAVMVAGDFSVGVTALILGIVVGLIVETFATVKDAKVYRKAYKSYFVETTMRKYFTDLNYSHERGMPRAILTATGMINTGDNYYSNDFTMGKYRGTTFLQADVKIEDEYTDSDGDRHTVTLFSGRWMAFEFPKKFNFRIMIKGKRGGNILMKKKRDGEKRRKYERIEVESGEFNKLFKLYAEDGFETFYLLDPVFIRNITELGEESQGRILLCFVDNWLHIGINNYEDSFEPPRKISRALDEQVEFQKVEREVKTVTKFVDRLKLETKIWENDSDLGTNALGETNPGISAAGIIAG